MSKHNKVNPDHYKVGGRLTPDEMARERAKQRTAIPRNNARGSRASSPPWVSKAPAADEDAAGRDEDDSLTDSDSDAHSGGETAEDGTNEPIAREGRSRTSGRVIAAGRSASRTGKRSSPQAPVRAAQSADAAKASTGGRRATATRSTTTASRARKASGVTKGRKR